MTAPDIGGHGSSALSAVSLNIVGPTVNTNVSGSTFVVCIAHENASTINTVTDNFGNTWVKQGSTYAGGTGATFAQEIWMCVNGVGGTGLIVTAAQTPTNLGAMYFDEILNGDLTSPLDQNSGWTTDGATPFTQAVGPTTSAAEVLLAYAMTGSNSGTEVLTWGGTNVFTALDAQGNANFFTGGSAKFLTSSTGTYTASVTSAGAGTGAVNLIVLSFKAPSNVSEPDSLFFGSGTVN